MIRPHFLDPESRRDLIELVRDGSAAHRLARRANALVLLDDGMSCAAIAKVLFLDDDTIRTWYWQCYRILAQECWPILAHPPSCNLRSARLDRGAFCGLESQSGFVRAAPSGA